MGGGGVESVSKRPPKIKLTALFPCAPQLNEGQHAHLPSLSEEDRALVMNQYSQFRSMIEEALQSKDVSIEHDDTRHGLFLL